MTPTELVELSGKIRSYQHNVDMYKILLRHKQLAIDTTEADLKHQVYSDSSLKNEGQRSSKLKQLIFEDEQLAELNESFENIEKMFNQAYRELKHHERIFKVWTDFQASIPF